MKQISYILVILISVFFSSCEKETLEVQSVEKDKNTNNIYVNPADTAGIIVPAGYSMVIMGESQTGTKAVSSSDRISHLQYLLYEDTGAGYKLYKREKVFESTGTKNWPYDAQIEILPKGKSWKVVFLGNMSKSIFGAYQTEEVLTGVEEGVDFYDDARIHSPQVEFTAQTMYHLVEKDFSTSNDDNTVEVPVLLKRIVSRHDIYQEGSNDMATYYSETLKDKLYGDIFTNYESVFRYQLRDAILKEIIWPFTCAGLAAVTTPENHRSTYKVVDWYFNNPDLYAQEYKVVWEKYVERENQLGFLKKDDYLNNYFLNFAEYLYEAFVEGKDQAAVENALSQICIDNYEGFIEQIQSKIGILFKANYTSGILVPWSGHAIINRSAVPSVIKLSFEVKQRDSAGQKFYQGNKRTSGRNYISIVTLPEQDETYKLVLNEILQTPFHNGGGIEVLPTTNHSTVISSSLLEGGPYLQNKKYDCIQKVTGATLIDKTKWASTESNWYEVKLSYENIMGYLSLDDDSKGTITIGSPTNKKTLCSNQVYNGTSYATSSGQIITFLNSILRGVHNEYPITTVIFPFKFKAPLFKDNIDATIVWGQAIPNTAEL